MSPTPSLRSRRRAALAAIAGAVVLTAIVTVVAVDHGVGRTAAATQALVSTDPAGGVGPAPGADREPSISGDGRYVVFTDVATSGQPLAFVRDITTATPSPVPPPDGTNRQDHAAISGDGCHVAFWASNATAGAPGASTTSSSSSSTVAAGGADVPALYTWDRCAGSRPEAVPTAGVVLTAAASIVRPALSADGRYVVYAAAPGPAAAWHVAVVDTTSGSEQELDAPPAAVAAMLSVTTLDISADGATVVFDAGPTAGSSPTTVLIWTAAGGVRPLSTTPAGGVAGGINAMPSVSADGRIVAFVSSSTDLAAVSGDSLQLYVHDVTAAVTTLVTPTPGTPQAGNAIQPDLTPDGSQVAFALEAPAAPPNLTAAVTGPARVIVARSTAVAGAPAFASAATETISTGATAADGAAAPGTSSAPAISASGGETVYASDAGAVLSGTPGFAAGVDVWLAQRNAALSIGPTSIDAGTVDVGSSSPAQVVQVTNPSNVSVTIDPVTAPGGGFAIVGDGCSAVLLPAGRTCSLSVVFRPLAAGAASASLVVAGDGQQATVALSGTGRLLRRSLGVDDATVQFPSTAVGARGGPLAVTVRNTGDVPTAIAGATLQGTSAGQFFVVGGCAGQTLAPDATCAVQVVALPSVAGSLQAVLTVSGTSGESTSATLHVVAFTSTVTTTPAPTTTVRPGRLAVDPSTITFATTPIGGTSPDSAVTVSNDGGAAVSIVEVSIEGGDGQFALSSDRCSGAQLAAGRTCALTLVVHPHQGGEASATLTVRGSRGESATVALGVESTYAPSLAAVPGVVRPGDLTTVRGSGFPPNRPVTLELTSASGTGPGLPLGAAVTGADGTLTLGVVVPPSGLASGGWQIVVVDQPDFSGGRAALLVDQASAAPGAATGSAGIGGIPRPGPPLP